MIIVVGGIKGGGGKTTIATNLAVWGTKNGKKTLLIDADEQKSATSWSEQREATLKENQAFNGTLIYTPATIALSGKFLYQQIKRFQQDYDLIVVDTGGRDTTSQRSALSIADVFLVPFKPRSFDVWTLGDVKRLIEEISTVNPNLKSYYVINQGDSRGNDNSEAMDIITEMECMEQIPAVIGCRKAFSNAAAQGLSVWELQKTDEKACVEMDACASFVYTKHMSKKYNKNT